MKRELSLARVLVVVSMLLALAAGMVNATPGMANLAGSPFDAGDGNLVLDDETQDWVNAPGRAVGIDQPTGQQDNSFGQGTKEDTEVPSVVSGSIPNNKSDLLRFYIANERVAGKEFLYLAWERVQEPNGTTNMDFEFNQSTAVSGNGVTPVRTAGDVLIKYDLSQGGVNPVLGYHLWVTSGVPAQVCEASNSVPCWGPVQSLSGNFEGSINTVIVTDPIPPNEPRNLSVRTFGEAAINLTDSGILPPGTCQGFGRAYLKSRSSDSFTAALKDFIAPIAVNISNCGTIRIHKVTVPAGGTGFNFTASAGLTPSSFSLDDGGTRVYTNTLAGSYTITETNPGPAYDLTSISCSVTGSGGSSTSTNLGNRTATINLSVNDIVDCTYTNTSRGTLIVKKITDPPGATGVFSFTASGGLIPTSFGLQHNQTYTYTNVLSGTYGVTETVPIGWDLISATCNDGSSVGAIGVSAGETVLCTFTNRQRGTVNVHKQDDTGANLAGAVFTLYNDNAPVGGTRGAEDTSTGVTCAVDGSGNCSFPNVVPGNYWVVETTTPPGHATAPDQPVVVGAGGTVPLTFVDPREFKVIVLVCRESDNTLYPSTVTVDGVNKTSLATGGGGTITDAQLCGLGGASYGDKQVGNHPANVNIPATPVP